MENNRALKTVGIGNATKNRYKTEVKSSDGTS
jgi:hypothetical protein